METKAGDGSHDREPTKVNGQDVGSSGGQTAWDEDRIDQADKKLKDMYIKVRELRTTLPRLVAPLTAKQPSPEAVFRQLSTAAATANSEVKQFRQLIEDDQSREIFEHVKESHSQNPKGILPWRITEDPDWLNKKS